MSQAYINLSASVLVRGTLEELQSTERWNWLIQITFLILIFKKITHASKFRISKLKKIKQKHITPCFYFHSFFFLTSVK